MTSGSRTISLLPVNLPNNNSMSLMAKVTWYYPIVTVLTVVLDIQFLSWSQSRVVRKGIVTYAYLSTNLNSSLFLDCSKILCYCSLIGNWESGACSLACQVSYTDIRWYKWAWQKCALKDWMIPWSRGWLSLVAFGGKHIMHRFWYWKSVSGDPEGWKILTAQTWD